MACWESTLAWLSVPGPSRPAWCPPHWGMCCSPCLWRGLGLPGHSLFTSASFPVSSQLPAPPKFNFHIRESWNSGRPGPSARGVGWGGGGSSPPSLVTSILLPGRACPSLLLLLCVPLLHLKEKGWRFQGSGSRIEALILRVWATTEHISCGLRQGEALPLLCLSFPVWS